MANRTGAAGRRLQSAPWAVTSQRGRAGWRLREAALVDTAQPLGELEGALGLGAV
jgi:hypothetical protein